MRDGIDLFQFQEFQVPFQALVFSAFHRAVLKYFTKKLFGDLVPFPGGIFKEPGVIDELRFLVRHTEAVPGAYILAHIAAKGPVVKLVF